MWRIKQLLLFQSLSLQSIKMGHDVSTGVIELIMDHFAEENEGTYTCQIVDGGGKAQSSLVLIGDGKRSLWTQYKQLILCIDGHYRLALLLSPIKLWC